MQGYIIKEGKSVELAIRIYSNSSESNVNSCLAHVTTLSAKSSMTMKRGHFYYI